jgi:Na+/H+ antiporter NhaD/arsenite permease-like protein
VLAAVRPLRLRTLPFLLAVALGANVGSALTPTGNPQNMLIAVASGVPFVRFVAALALPSLGGLVLVACVLLVAFRRDLAAPLPAGVAVPDALFDRGLVIRALAAFAGALAGWLAGFPLPLVSIAAAAVLLLVARRDPARAFEKVEWPLLLFFAALFVVMRGARDLPVVASLTANAAAHLGAGRLHDAALTSGAMVALSNLVSNVPAVLLWRPVMAHVASPAFVWLVMAMSSTFAGNLTLLGSMANLIVVERAEARGERVGFFDYLKVGVPVTALTLAWGIAAMVLLRA